MSGALKPETVQRIREAAAQYPRRDAAMLPALWAVQEERGWIGPPEMAEVAELLGVSPVRVFGVVSFYTLFDTRPRGRHKVQVCRTLSCALAGSARLCERLRSRLGVGAGETSADGQFAWEEVECLASCGTGPVVQVDGESYEGLSTEGLDRVLDGILGNVPRATPDRASAPKPVLGAPPFLSQWFGEDGPIPISVYAARGGYRALREARARPGGEVLEAVKASGLRGRGGAGFPTGTKWGFIPKVPSPAGSPIYVVVNADESEPGAFKDRALLELAPHLVIEGILLACHAVGAQSAYVYVRGEFAEPYRTLTRAVAEARDAGLVGAAAGADLILHRGAGAYICGEETALLESLEGKKGYPRLRPPFPAQKGLFGQPTVVNNVETLATVPVIMAGGAANFAKVGTPKSPGTKLVSISGRVRRPGLYEVPLGVPLKRILHEVAGGPAPGRSIKAVIPGGSSTPILTVAEAEEITFDWEALASKGTFLGTGGIIVLDDGDCLVRVLANLARFYAHESCGQCTPCREGTGWSRNLLAALEAGHGTARDLALLKEIAGNMRGRTICVLADALAMPVQSYLQRFGPEFEAHLSGKCPLPESATSRTSARTSAYLPAVAPAGPLDKGGGPA